MSHRRPIFRSAALHQPPEQYDEVVRLMPISHWVWLLAFGSLLAAAVMWGLFGRLTLTTQYYGVIVTNVGIAVTFVPIEQAQQLRAGMEARIVANPAQPDDSQAFTGVVFSIAEATANPDLVRQVMGETTFATLMAQNSPVYEVRVQLDDPVDFPANAPCEIVITTREASPIRWVLP
jgi:hypothetical protein